MEQLGQREQQAQQEQPEQRALLEQQERPVPQVRQGLPEELHLQLVFQQS